MAIYQKQTSVGSFLEKGKDINDGDLVTIASEGQQVEGKYGMQDLFLVKTQENEGNVSFNKTSLNCMIDAYGEESKNWIGKQVKVWAILSNVQGKMIKVYYFTHPKAECDSEGNFIITDNDKAPEHTVSTEPAPENTSNVKLEDIPF